MTRLLRCFAALAGAMLALAASGPTATAQTVRCSAFLHERDGSWRSFEPGIIFGPRGEPIRVQTGQRFSGGFVASLLDTICRSE